MPAPPVWMVGAGGRTPFVGHFRGVRTFGGTRLAWAGRVAGTAAVPEGWQAAESARDALAELVGSGDPAALLGAACAALGRIDPRWLARDDLSVLFVASDPRTLRAAGAGLGAVHALADGASHPLVPPGHPLLGEPGLPDGRSWEIPAAEHWIGVPTGLVLPPRGLAAACGVHT